MTPHEHYIETLSQCVAHEYIRRHHTKESVMTRLFCFLGWHRYRLMGEVYHWRIVHCRRCGKITTQENLS
jgi:hypothetical protein